MALPLQGGKLTRIKYDGDLQPQGDVAADGLHAHNLASAHRVAAKLADVRGCVSAAELDLADFNVGTLDVAGAAKLAGGRLEGGGRVGGALAADRCRLKGELSVGRGTRLARCEADVVLVQLGGTEADGKPDICLTDSGVLRLEFVGRAGTSRCTKSEVKETVNSAKRPRGRPKKEQEPGRVE